MLSGGLKEEPPIGADFRHCKRSEVRRALQVSSEHRKRGE